MSKLELSKTEFEIAHHDIEKARTCHDEYVFHNMCVWHFISINGNQHEATWQNGHSYISNDYRAPSNKFELYDEDCPLFGLIYNLSETDFKDEDFILEKLEEVKEIEPAINSIEKLYEVYQYLQDDRPCLEDFLEPCSFSK